MRNALDSGFHGVPADAAHPDRDADGAGVKPGPQEHQQARLADLDFGAEPSRRAGGQPGRGLAAGQLLQAQRQRAGPRPETEHDGHLHHARRRARCHDAPDPGPLARGKGLGEQADPVPDPFGRPGSELSRRPGAGQDFGDYLGELPGPGDDGIRRPVGGAARAERERRTGRLGTFRCAPVLVGTRARHGYLARRRARGAVHLAVIRRPAAGYLNQAQPAEGGRRSRRSSSGEADGGPAGGPADGGPAGETGQRDRPSRRATARWLTCEMTRRVPGRECGQTACSAFQSGECERPRTPVTASAYSPAAHGCTSGHRHSGVLAGH